MSPKNHQLKQQCPFPDISCLTLCYVYTLCHGRAEPNTIKLGDNTANIKLNRILPNLVIKFGSYVNPLLC